MPDSHDRGERSRDALMAEVRRRAARRRLVRRGTIAAVAVAACASVAVPLAMANGGGTQSVNVIAPPSTPTSEGPAPTTTTTPGAGTGAALTLAGYRGIRFGMTPAEAGAALGTPPTTGPNGNGTCADVSFAGLPSGLTLYVIGGKIVAMEIGPGSSVSAPGGTHIGSTVDDVLRALGTDVVAQPSNDQTRTDLVYRTADPATVGNEIRYVVTGGKVSDIVAGVRSYVDQQELCG